MVTDFSPISRQNVGYHDTGVISMIFVGTEQANHLVTFLAKHFNVSVLVAFFVTLSKPLTSVPIVTHVHQSIGLVGGG